MDTGGRLQVYRSLWGEEHSLWGEEHRESMPGHGPSHTRPSGSSMCPFHGGEGLAWSRWADQDGPMLAVMCSWELAKPKPDVIRLLKATSGRGSRRGRLIAPAACD